MALTGGEVSTLVAETSLLPMRVWQCVNGQRVKAELIPTRVPGGVLRFVCASRRAKHYDQFVKCISVHVKKEKEEKKGGGGGYNQFEMFL